MEAESISVARSSIGVRLDEVVQRSNQRSAQLVWLFGDTGQGKTHFIREYIEARRTEASVAYARCAAPVGNQSSSMLSPHQALKDVIEDLLRGQDNAQRHVNLIKNVSLTILACIPFVGDVAYGIKEIRRDLSEYKRGERSVELEKFVEEYFSTLARLSNDAPVIVVIDDIQWADTQTVQALEHFFSHNDWATSRVSIILAGRQSEIHASPELSAFYTRCAQSPRSTEILLPPFDSNQIRQFFTARFPAAPLNPDVLQWLEHKTGGNPFFLQSYIQHLLVENLLSEDGSLLGDLAAYRGLPAEIKVVTAWLMKVLSEDDLNILLAASVLGYEFSLHELAHLTQRPPLELIRRLRKIRTLFGVCELVGYKLANGRESTVYRFSQHAIHTALYNELTAEEREELHRSTAQYLNQLRLASGNDNEQLGSLASALMLHARLGKQPDIEYESILLKARTTSDVLDEDAVLEQLKSLSPILGRPVEELQTLFERALALAPLHSGRPVAKAQDERDGAETPSNLPAPVQDTVSRVVTKLSLGRVHEALDMLDEYTARVKGVGGRIHPVLLILRAIALNQRGAHPAEISTVLAVAIEDTSQPAYQVLARLAHVALIEEKDNTRLFHQLTSAANYDGKFRAAFTPMIVELVRKRLSGKQEFAHVLRRLEESETQG